MARKDKKPNARTKAVEQEPALQPPGRDEDLSDAPGLHENLLELYRDIE